MSAVIRRPGRPAKRPQDRLTQLIAVHATSAEKEMLKGIASYQDTTPSQILRSYILRIIAVSSSHLR